jgi:predicted MFS family arabinose efflux permease
MVGGVLSDYLLRKTGSLKWSRCSIGIVSLAGAAIAIIPAAFFAKPVPVMICLIVCNFLVQLNNAPCWAVCLDIGGGYAGMVSSVMNMLAQLAAALSAILFGMFVQKGFWIAPFFVMAVILFGGALLWAFAINPERTVVERA